MIDETYLGELCDHLSEHPPRDGRWSVTARRWPRTPAPAGSGLLIAAPAHELYPAADAARLPTPPECDEDQRTVHENDLAAVLAAFAQVRAQGSSYGHDTDARTIAEVLATDDRAPMRHTLELLMRSQPEGYRRLLLLCGRARCSVDLRTVAAIAFTTAGRRETKLQTNPTGRWPHACRSGAWEPILTCARATWIAREAPRTDSH